mmetsp:Transcript_9815/g.24154  ORF Transcript_9815/g.24154 Transcript_9815/m.24154 type:complete len:84 (-) Transcript_9815:140-391(-)
MLCSALHLISPKFSKRKFAIFENREEATPIARRASFDRQTAAYCVPQVDDLAAKHYTQYPIVSGTQSPVSPREHLFLHAASSF